MLVIQPEVYLIWHLTSFQLAHLILNTLWPLILDYFKNSIEIFGLIFAYYMIFEEVDWKFKVASDKSWDIDSSEEWANDLLFWMWALQVFNYRLVNA